MSFFAILRANKISFVFSLLLCAIPLFVSSSIGYFAYVYESEIRGFSLPLWFLFYLLSIFTMAFAITPTTFISILSGYFLGWLCLPFVVISYLFAAILGFFIAKKIDGGKFINSLGEIAGIEGILKNLKDGELYITFLAKISPILPFALSNFLLSIGGANLRNFTIGSLLGMLPRTALAIYIGNEAQKIAEIIEKGNTGLGEQLFIVLLIIIGAVGLFKVFKKALVVT